MIYRFGPFELDTETRELRARGERVAIPPKPLAVLEYLVQHNDRMVPKAELLDAFWSANASEASLQTAISIARKTLAGYDPDPAIRTHHGRGFRFVAALQTDAAPPAGTPAVPAAPRERRLVAVLSVRLPDGADQAVAAERWQDAVEDFLAGARAAVEAERGQLIHMMPDGFTAAFGIDPPSEDGVRRAVSCAWDLRAAPETGALAVLGSPVTFGVETGPIALANGDDGAGWEPPGAIERGAASLALAAGQGDILLSAGTYHQLRDEVEAQVGPRGYTLGSRPAPRAGIPARPLRRAGPFVGRGAELAFLAAGLAGTRQGTGQAVVLSGPAGIGKSRLVGEFAAGLDRDGTRHLTVHCLPRMIDTPLAPIRELCRRLFAKPPAGTVRDDVDAALLARILGQPAPATPVLEGLSESVLRRRGQELVGRMVAAACQDGPLVLIFEDVHWIDPVSRTYLAALVGLADRARVMLVMTTRPADDAPLSEAVVRLSPLGHNDSMALLRDLPETAGIADDAAETLVARAAGNPFFLEELALAVRSGADPGTDMPHSVQAVIEVRIAGLEAGLRALLYAIAIIGPPAPSDLIAGVLDTDAEVLQPDLERLVKMGFLHDDPSGYACRHMLLHETAYAMIAPRDRMRLHGVVARLLEEAAVDAPPEVLAWHLQEAGERARAIACWTRASNAALYRSEGQAAITFARRGLALVDVSDAASAEGELRLQLSLAPGLMAQRGYAADEVGTAYYRAHQLSVETGSFRARLRSLLGLWVHTWVAGRLTESLTHGRDLLAMAEQTDDPALRLQGHCGLGSVLMHTGDLDAAMEHLEAGTRYIGETGPDTITVQNAAVTCTAYAAWVCALHGRSAEMRAFVEHSEALSRALENPFASAIHLALCAGAVMCAGDVAGCDDLAARAAVLSREQKFPFWLGTGLVIHGWAQGRRGQSAAGLEAIDEGIAIFEATGAGVQLANWYGLKAETLLAADRPGEGLIAAHHALACAGKTGDVWFAPRIHAAAAELHRRLGDADCAARHRALADGLVRQNVLSPAFATPSGG